MKLSRPQYGLQQQIVEAIYALRDKKSSELFRQPVDITKVPDYYQIITQPMDLSTILNKLKEAEYQQSDDVYQDLELIIANCMKYNRAAEAIIKKAEQFRQCIKTVWGNFRKEVQKKNLKYDQRIVINEEVLKRIAAIEEKKTKKKIPALQAVIEQERKNILPEQNLFIPFAEPEKVQKEQMPPGCEFVESYYLNVSREARKDYFTIQMDLEEIAKEFDVLSEKKLAKYRKIMKKILLWFDQKIIQKCLSRKSFQKMQVPKHLTAFIENGAIADELSIRKLQMYIKKITYWVEDNSNILSDYMKDKFIDNCRAMKRCIIRVIKYKKSTKAKGQLDMLLQGEADAALIENEKEEDNYQNKMKEFKRMLDKDREKSTKRDTKIILRNENGVMQVYDWTSEKKVERGIRKEGGGGTRIEQVDNDEKKKQEQRKRQQFKKDQQFIQDYSKRSNALLIAKYGNRLAIDWDEVRIRNFEFSKEISLNGTDDDNSM